MSDLKKTDLDLELVFDTYLGAGHELEIFQEVLRDLAPRWSSKLVIWRSSREKRPIDLRQPGALRSAVITAAAERGPTYAVLVKRYGAGDERLFGSVELRGAGPELTIVVSVDERIVSRLGDAKHLGNRITLQVRRAKVETQPSDHWLRGAFETLCGQLGPAWGSGQQVGEYWAKVMSDGPTIRAIGRDFGRFLPGVFWLNFFGSPYRGLIGRDQLVSAPAHRVAEIDHGVLVQLSASPWLWEAPDYIEAERAVRKHLGTEYFFAKEDPDRPGVAPAWDGDRGDH